MRSLSDPGSPPLCEAEPSLLVHPFPLPVQVQCIDPQWIPLYATAGSAGADLRAAVQEALVIAPGRFLAVPTGVRIALPAGWEAQVRPRSGLARKFGITVFNSPGTIDADYRGEIEVLLINLGGQEWRVEPGMRIAQLVVAPAARAEFVRVEQWELTERGEGGFGHTGTH